MSNEARRPPKDVRPGDEVFLPRDGTWAQVQSISAPDDNEIVWMGFTTGERHGFHTSIFVDVRTLVPAPAAPPVPPPAPAALPAPGLAAPIQHVSPPHDVTPPTPTQRALSPAPAPWGSPATAVRAPVPLSFLEHYEHARLRRAAPSSTEPLGKSDREDLDRLRGALRTELDRLRVITARYTCSPGVDPVDELLWRRGLVPVIEAAEEKARNEKARLAREAEEARLAGLKAKAQAEAWQATQHITLSAPERRWQELLRADYAAHGTPEEQENELIWSTPGDCGRKHWSPTAAYACANVRLEDAEARKLRSNSPPTRTSTAVAPVAQPRVGQMS